MKEQKPDLFDRLGNAIGNKVASELLKGNIVYVKDLYPICDQYLGTTWSQSLKEKTQ